MKKVSKLLATLLAVIVFASAFAITPSAVGPSSTAKEMLDYYEKCVIDTSAKEDVIKINAVGIDKTEADFSTLSDADIVATVVESDWRDSYSDWEEVHYLYGDDYTDYYVNGRSEFIDDFSIKRTIKRKDLTFKSAKLTEGNNGAKTLKFVYTQIVSGGYINTITITVKLDGNGYLKTYKIKQIANFPFRSAYGNMAKVVRTIDETFTFEYKEVDVEGIELSKNSIRINEGNEYKLKAVVSPENATFKAVYAKSANENIAECTVEDDGSILVTAVGEGTTTIKVYTWDGEFLDECKVTVKLPFMASFTEFFEIFLDWFIEVFNIIF